MIMAETNLHKPLFDLEQVFDVDDHLYFYREMLTDERTDAEVASLVKLLGLEKPLDILDLACGYGRHANRLAALGHRLTGVDLMEGFLELARQEADEKNEPVRYQQGDMRRITFREEFDRVMLLFTAFGYFDDADNLLVLKNARQALRPGGFFITDSLNRDLVMKNFQPVHVTEKDGNLMIDRCSFDSQNGLFLNQRIFIRDGVRRDKPFKIRLYNPNEFVELLRRAELEVVAMYGGFDAQPVSTESRRLVVLARKPAG
jgi:SAM-dependent methyltransferase